MRSAFFVSALAAALFLGTACSDLRADLSDAANDGTGGSSRPQLDGSADSSAPSTAATDLGSPPTDGASGNETAIGPLDTGADVPSRPGPTEDARAEVDAPSSCATSCVLGSQRCEGTRIRACVRKSDGCADWEPARDCPAPQTCFQNSCVCPSGCSTVGTKECDPNGSIRQCIQDGACRRWSQPMTCSAPNGTAICQGNACTVASCNGGFNRCDGVCVRGDDTSACGTSCTKCPSVQNGVPTCATGTCGGRCNDGYTRCNLGSTACEQSSWGFESGTTEGLVIGSRETAGTITDEGHTGVKAASVVAVADPNGFIVAELRKESICAQRGGMTAPGKRVSMWVFVDENPGNTPGSACSIALNDQPGSSVSVPNRSWVNVASASIAGALDRFHFACTSRGTLPTRWVFDDVKIQ